MKEPKDLNFNRVFGNNSKVFEKAFRKVLEVEEAIKQLSDNPKASVVKFGAGDPMDMIDVTFKGSEAMKELALKELQAEYAIRLVGFKESSDALTSYINELTDLRYSAK